MSGSTGRASFYLSGARLLLYRIALSIAARGSWAGGVAANPPSSQAERGEAPILECRAQWRIAQDATPALGASGRRASPCVAVTRGTCRCRNAGALRVEGWTLRVRGDGLGSGSGDRCAGTEHRITTRQ